MSTSNSEPIATDRLSDLFDIMPPDAHTEHINRLTAASDIGNQWRTVLGLDQRRIDLVNFIGLLEAQMQTWSGRSVAMECSQEVLRMAAKATDGSKAGVRYVKECMVSEKTQEMTEDARSAFVGRLRELRVEANELLTQLG